MNDLELCAFVSARLDDDETRAKQHLTNRADEEFNYRGRKVTIHTMFTPDPSSRTFAMILEDVRSKRLWSLRPSETGEITSQMRITDEAKRTLREVAAKRVILMNAQALLESEDTHTDVAQHYLAHMMLRNVLVPIASIYDDHPDFQPEWSFPLHQFESTARAHTFIRQQQMQAQRLAEVTQTPRLWLS